MAKTSTLSIPRASSTPGPWRKRGNQILGLPLISGYRDAVPSEVVALLPVGEPKTGEYAHYPKETAAANARLILKAPDMFQLLCEIAGAAEIDGLDEKSNVWRTLMINLEGIIQAVEPTPT